MPGAEDLVTQVQQPGQAPQGKQAGSSSSWLRFCCLAPTPQQSTPAQTTAGAPRQAPPQSAIALEQPGRQPPPKFLLPPLDSSQAHKKCLVLDLDETLVHSSFKPINDSDFNIKIELEGTIHTVYVKKRPGVDFFLQEVGKKFEIVIFTASLAKYADPLLDELDKDGVVQFRLFREACVFHYGNYVKDLTHLGRTLESSIIVDNSPMSYLFQPDNAIPITSWFSNKSDRELYDLLPYLDKLAAVDDVVTVITKKEFDFLSPTNN